MSGAISGMGEGDDKEGREERREGKRKPDEHLSSSDLKG